MSTSPHLTLFRALFTPDECNYLAEAAAPIEGPDASATTTET